MSWACGARQYPVHMDLSHSVGVVTRPQAKWMKANNYLQMRNNCQGASARCRSVGDKVMPAGPVCAAGFRGSLPGGNVPGLQVRT